MHDAQTSDAVLQHCNNLLVYFISLCLFALRDPLIALQHLLHLARTPYIIELGKHKDHDLDVRNMAGARLSSFGARFARKWLLSALNCRDQSAAAAGGGGGAALGLAFVVRFVVTPAVHP